MTTSTGFTLLIYDNASSNFVPGGMFGPKFRTRAGLIVTALLCAIVLPANASVVYVNANQTNNLADGTSWATAFPKVQQAIDVAGRWRRSLGRYRQVF